MSDHPNPTRLWANRRRMAWLSIGGIIGIGIGGLIVELTEPQSALLQAVVYSLSLITGAYVASATWDDIESRRTP